ncbi:MAG: DUF4153 domain-containing protein, partial [Litorimonas sp.]
MTSRLKSWGRRLPDIGEVIKRFPAVTVIMAIATLYFVVVEFPKGNDPITLTVIGLMAAAYLGVMQTLWAEVRGRKPNWILHMIMAASLAAVFYVSDDLRLNVVMIISAILLFLGNSVRFGRERDDLSVWDFTHKIWAAAGFAVLGSIIYLVGVSAISFALKSLFGLDISALVERLLLPIGFVFLAPLYWLSNVPPVDEPCTVLEDNPSFASKVDGFMGTWMLSPLTLIYALILLAYAVKILLLRALPEGEIAWLTLPFLVIGTLTWLLLEPPFIQKNGLARMFRKFWFALSIPAAIMLSISIAVRVLEYGLTVERIVLILACVWSLGLAVWFVFGPKPRRDIRIIPAFAGVLLLAAAPSASYLSIGSQAARFETNLVKAGILQADGSVKKGAITDKVAAVKAEGALIYLTENDARPRVESILHNSDIKVDANMSSFEAARVFSEELGLTKSKEVSQYKPQNDLNRIEYKLSENFTNVSGYERVYEPKWMWFKDPQKNATKQVLITSEGQFTLEYEGTNLYVSDGATQLYSYNLKSWLDSIPET